MKKSILSIVFIVVAAILVAQTPLQRQMQHWACKAEMELSSDAESLPW